MASGLSPFTPAYAVREDAAAGKSKSPTTLQGEHINSHAKQYPAPAQIRHKVYRARASLAVLPTGKEIRTVCRNSGKKSAAGLEIPEAEENRR